jgi:hypothetical protein
LNNNTRVKLAAFAPMPPVRLSTLNILIHSKPNTN